MIGKEILNYTIISLIGKGGMGSVYLAEHKFIKQQKVAIKVINGGMVNDFTRQKMAEEAEKLATMNHPNIVHFINYHIDDEGIIYLIMEYAEGYSLEDYINKVTGLIVEEKLCPIFEPLLDAFEYAHRNKIIHKDIKPSNIIITPDGTPKVLDFGISGLLNDHGKEEKTDLIMGTPSYMSPEQVKGLPLDERSDIYSLGVLLHQMLTGNAPYDTTTMTEHDIYKRVVEEELPRMKTYYKYVSDKIQAIVDKATSKNAKDRYQTCAEFKKAIHNAIYPPKISLGVKAIAAVAMAVVLAGVVFIWDYNRTKVSYYKDYTEKWSVPQGIGNLSSAEKSHLSKMYRFEYQHYKLQRVSNVNSQDIIVVDGESEHIDRPIDVRFYYNSDGNLSRAKVFDQNGQVLYIKSYNEKLNTVVFLFDDEYGTEKTIGKQTVGYVDAFAADQNRGKISRYLLEYDENGYTKSIRYAGFQNVLVSDAQGIYGKEFVRDEKGRVIEEHYLSHDGSPKATKWGMGKKLFAYDEDDNWVKCTYLTIDGKPSLDAEEGTCVCENVYDKYGNVVAQYYKNIDGSFAFPGMYEAAGHKSEFDERGFLVKQSFIGVDGNVLFSPKQGFAIAETECNEYGFCKKVCYQDAEGNPIKTSEGNSYVKIVTDSKGNTLERWFYDTDNHLVANSEGAAGVKAEYDSLGHVVKQVFYDTEGKVCEISEGYAGWNREFDEKGEILKVSFFDSDFQPVVDLNNVSTSVCERDMRGNVTKNSYYGVDGKLTKNSQGIAVIEYKYDDNGNEIERKYYNEKEELTKDYEGVAQTRFTYDDKGNVLSEKFYGTRGELVLSNGVAGVVYKRDGHGNVTEHRFIGTDEGPVEGKLMARYKYDERDNVIEYSLFTGDGEPATNALGYHRFTQIFNERNKSVEDRYYNTDGELTLYATNNYSIARYEYNDRGLLVKISYFDTNDKPADYIGDADGNYSIRKNEYDEFGRVVRQYYFDKDGLPTNPKIMVPEAVVEYDQQGNVVYLACCDGNGKLIMNPRTGWSYMRCGFDTRKNLLWSAYYNDKERAIISQEGYHKVVRTYTKSNKVTSEAYYNASCRPMSLDGYHMVKYKYDENELCIEISYWDEMGRAVNTDYALHKIVFSYNKDNSLRDRKSYNLDGRLLLHQQLVNDEWVQVKNWQKDVNDFADRLPMKLGSKNGNLVVRSAKLIGSDNVQVLIIAPKSKYEMSNSLIREYKAYVANFLNSLRKKEAIPSHVKLTGVLKDSKGRIFSTIYK